VIILAKKSKKTDEIDLGKTKVVGKADIYIKKLKKN